MNELRKRFNSLEDVLRSYPLTIDGLLNDGGDEHFAVKGIECEAAILFADIGGFSRRCRSLDPAETLAFVNQFFTWISAEAVRHSNGIVDKYIGDEVMVVFPSFRDVENPVSDALRTAIRIADWDVFAFCPHIGIAAGPVILGYVGTPLSYNCSVFGHTVALAARCAHHKPDAEHRASITLPAALWQPAHGQLFERPVESQAIASRRTQWQVGEPRTVDFKNVGSVEIREMLALGTWFPQSKPEERAKIGVASLRGRVP